MAGSAMREAGCPEDAAQPASAKVRIARRILEGDFVIHLVALEAGRGLAGAAAAATKAAATTAAFAALAVQHGEFAAEILQHHLGGVFLGPVLVGPFAGLQATLDID